jgi:hypothetical protein
MTPLTSLALLAALAAPPDGGWKFVDEATCAGRPVVIFRTAEMSDTPARPLHRDDAAPLGANFGVVPLGPGGRHRLGLVWHAASNSVWLDADGDGRYSPAERHRLGDKPLEVKVTVPFGEGTSEGRTLLVRRRGDGVAYAVRGYTIGSVTIGGKEVAALLTDGDADGCFDGSGADRVWLDLDGDGKFDPLTEQFPVGTVTTHGGTAFLARPRANGLGLAVRERPAESGTLTVKVGRLPGSEMVELAAQYASEFGELVVVRKEGEALPVPAGRYRIESVHLSLADADGKVWYYWFASGERSAFDVEVRKGRGTIHVPLDRLRASVSLGDAEAVTPGGAVQVQPDVTAGRLYLTRCEAGGRDAECGREVPAELRLNESGSVTVDRASSGFV